MLQDLELFESLIWFVKLNKEDDLVDFYFESFNHFCFFVFINDVLFQLLNDKQIFVGFTVLA